MKAGSEQQSFLADLDFVERHGADGVFRRRDQCNLSRGHTERRDTQRDDPERVMNSVNWPHLDRQSFTANSQAGSESFLHRENAIVLVACHLHHWQTRARKFKPGPRETIDQSTK